MRASLVELAQELSLFLHAGVVAPGPVFRVPHLEVDGEAVDQGVGATFHQKIKSILILKPRFLRQPVSLFI